MYANNLICAEFPTAINQRWEKAKRCIVRATQNMRCLMVCHSKFYTHVDIVYVLYGRTDPYRKWPDGTYRSVILVCSKYMSHVHIARMSMACFPVPLYSQERKKKRCVEVSPSHRRTVAPFHHRQPRWATFPMMPPAQGKTPPPKP